MEAIARSAASDGADLPLRGGLREAEIDSVVFHLNGGQLVSGQAEQNAEAGSAAIAPQVTSGISLNLAINVRMLEELPEEKNLSVNKYVEWWRTEIERSYRSTNAEDTEYYTYSIVNTYQHVTGAECVFSVMDLDDLEADYVEGYDSDYIHYFYNYTSCEDDQYVEHLKKTGL